MKLGISADTRRSDLSSEIEPIHTVSFSIGDGLGDIKVAVMHLKAQLERIEGSMLSKEYYEQSTKSKDKSNLMMSKLDETLGKRRPASNLTCGLKAILLVRIRLC
jgi:hypothetical protein